MRPPRRGFLHLATGAAALSTVSRFAWAQAYPMRPVHLIVGFGAGGTPDILARILGQSLSERLGQQLVIENRPGGGTNIASETVVRAAPDGYTLLLIATPNITNAIFYDDLKFDFMTDLVPISGVSRVPQLMVVNPTFPVQTVPELIAYAKAHPGSINFASTGIGNISQLSAELFKLMANVDMLHVPYRSAAAAQTDLLSGRVQLMIDTMPALIEHVRSGRLRALAVTSSARSQLLPDIQPVADFLPGFEVSGVAGVGAPRDTPRIIVEKLNREINRALEEPSLTARFTELGATVLTGTPADFRKLLVDETEKWRRVISQANIKPDR
jgi:tripartite-type tricarboxylate transporter receptor subunit TctC